MKYLSAFFLLLLTMFSAHGEDKGINEAFLASLINDIKQEAGLPSGTAIAVVQGDKLIYDGYFGFRDIKKNLPVNNQTRFYIASTTKPLTALNFLLDVQQTPALETTTIKDMFPSFELSERHAVTAAQLITHTASINNLPLVFATAYSGLHDEKTRLQLVNQLSTASSEPIGEFKYTNVGYNIYSVYADERFGETWQQKLKNQIFKPADMTASTAVRTDIAVQSNIAKSYSLPRFNNNDALYLEKNDQTLHAAGGVYSTATDLSRFIIAQLNDGVIDGKQVYPRDVIARSQIKQATTDKTYGSFKRDGYAWGWYTGDYKDQRMLHHFGGFAGIHTHLSFMPSQKIGLVVLNSEDFLSTRLTGIIADYVYGALLGETDIEHSVMEKANALKARLSGLDAMLAKEQNKINGRKWNLSLPEKAYIGDYHHPLLGTVKVTLNEANRFDVTWGVMHSDSTGMNEPDQIRVLLEPTSGSVMVFNVEDKVISLNYSGIEFVKTP